MIFKSALAFLLGFDIFLKKIPSAAYVYEKVHSLSEWLSNDGWRMEEQVNVKQVTSLFDYFPDDKWALSPLL